MRSVQVCLPWLILIGVAATVRAEGQFDPAVRAATIAPFIDEQTIAVFRAQPARIEADPLVDLFLELFPELNPLQPKGRDQSKQLRTAFLEGGFTDLYCVVSMADLEGPFFVIPNPEQRSVDKLKAVWLDITEGKGDFNDVMQFKGAVVVGNPEKLQRLEEAFVPGERPQLTEAFKVAGDTAVELIFCPSEDQRRVAKEMAPGLIEKLGGGSMIMHARSMAWAGLNGVIWAAAGVDTPPDSSVHLVVRTEDGQAAAALRDKLLESVKIAAEQQPEVLFGRFETERVTKAIPLLRPQVAGDRLTLTLAGQDGPLNAVLDALKPSRKLFPAGAASKRDGNRADGT